MQTPDWTSGDNTYLRRRRAAALLCLLCIGAVVGSGCLVDEKPYPANQPPLTYLRIEGDSLYENIYRTIMHWWGTDRDGHVVGFAYRWSAPWEPEPGDSLWWEDSSWVFTAAYLDTFDVPIGGEFAERTFAVRAIDNGLLSDPEPATQVFPLINWIPTVMWTDTTRHPTLEHPSLPAISFAWTPEDFDGRETISHVVLWLDLEDGEDPDGSTITIAGEDTVGAFFPEHFQGRYGQRTAYLQLFDHAATGSDTISWTWNVVEPSGEYLLIDNAWPYEQIAARWQDDFWRARMDVVVPGNYHVYDVEIEGPFRSRQEVLPLFQLFKGVVWYGIIFYENSGEMDAAMREGLQLAEGSLHDYVSSGSGMLISGHNLIGTASGLSDDFLEGTFGIEQIYVQNVDDIWTSNFSLNRRTAYNQPTYVRSGPAFGGIDSLRMRVDLRGIDAFEIGPELEPVLWLEPATLDTLKFPANATEPFYMGAVVRWEGGELALCSTTLADFHPASHPNEAIENLIRRILESR